MNYYLIQISPYVSNYILLNMLEFSTKSNIIVFKGANMVVTTSILRQQYKNYNNPLDKIKRDVDKGILFRLNRGIYETDIAGFMRESFEKWREI